MAVHFKFRSSLEFDSLDIGTQSSISLHHLKSKILLKLHLVLSTFDLLFFDSLSGIEYTDENTQIPSGSSVIIKRVPAKLPQPQPQPPSPSLLREVDVSAGHVVGMDAQYANLFEPPVLDFGVNEWDDLRVDFCSPPVANVSNHLTPPLNIDEKKYSLIRRCSVKPPVRREKLESTFPLQSNPKDAAANEGNMLEMHSKSIIKDQTKLGRAVAVKNIAMESFDLPVELKCSICTTFFKEAVMIPCCQHSFCKKCIYLALVENSRCPRCSSTKCKPEDLLPNLSLSKTVERFLESRRLQIALEKDLDRYAPDGESGIQVKELSNNDAVPQREFEGEKTAGADEEANSSPMKGQYHRDVTGGGERDFIVPGRLNQGLRTCYICGSPDHFIRDCPSAASSCAGSWSDNPPFQGVVPGYAPQYWPGNPPHGKPLYNMYCGPEMMMYNTNMSAVPPFAASPYASTMFNAYPVASGPSIPGVMAPFSETNAPQMNQTGVRASLRSTEAIEIERGPLIPGVMAPFFGTNAPQMIQTGIRAPLRAKQRESHTEAIEIESGPLIPRVMAPFSGTNASQMNQTGIRAFLKEKQRGSHTEAIEIERREVLDQDQKANKQSDNAERGLNHSNDGFPTRSGHRRSHEHSGDDDQYSNEKSLEKLSQSSEGERNLRNAHLAKSTSEKVIPDSRIRPAVERRESSHRHSKRNEEIRTQHDSDSGQIHERRSDRKFYSHSRSGLEHNYSSGDGRRRRNESGQHDGDSNQIHHYSNKRSEREFYSHSGSGLEHNYSSTDGRRRRNESGQHDGDFGQIHHYSNKESMQKRRINDDRRSDQNFYSHSGSGLELNYSSVEGRQRRTESGPRPRHSEEKSKLKSKDKYHDRERMTKYSNDDYGEDYHSRKRQRYH